VRVNQSMKQHIQVLCDNFGPDLFMCKIKRPCGGVINFFHFFITDGKWTLEFGDEHWYEGAVPQFHVQVHCGPLPTGTEPAEGGLFSNSDDSLEDQIIEEKAFLKSPAVAERMKEVCGITNWSLCFANSEHVCRYVAGGNWTSSQIMEGTDLRRVMAKYMTEYQRKLLNTKPLQLTKQLQHATLHKDAAAFVIHTKTVRAMDQVTHEEMNDAFNIVLLGPTGSGKSNLINHYFNATVSQSKGAASSVTNEILFFSGTASLARAPTKDVDEWHLEERRVNIVDTIGLCDTVLEAPVLHALIKEKLKGNLAHIDRVVFVCAGRVTQEHQDAIEQFQKWLRFSTYFENFTFIYNKADLLQEEDREQALFDMCGMLKAGNHVLTCHRDLFPSAVLRGSNPGVQSFVATVSAKRECVLRTAIGLTPDKLREDDMMQLLDSTMIPVMNKTEQGYQRIPLSEEDCTIL